MDDQIGEDIKEARLDRLMRRQQEISLHRNELRIGTEEKVLVEELRSDGTAVGRSASEAPDTDGVVYLTGCDEYDVGCFVPCRITGADTYDLTGVKL